MTYFFVAEQQLCVSKAAINLRLFVTFLIEKADTPTGNWLLDYSNPYFQRALILVSFSCNF